MNRIRVGWCAVPNPNNLHNVSTIDLSPSAVDAIVFWSKNPEPMMNDLQELDERGYRYYFQFTLNAYPAFFEPNVPGLASRISTFRKLSEQLGISRVIWRYDPIIISNLTPEEFHINQFAALVQQLKGSTRRVIVSLVDLYSHTERRLASLEVDGLEIERHPKNIIKLMANLAEIAHSNGLEICSCSEVEDYAPIGILPGQCIDAKLINSIWSLHLKYIKDPGQRPACLCTVGKDIGVNDSCIHGCTYCYSTRSYSVAENRFKEHDVNSPLLWGNSEMKNKIVPPPQKQQGNLFLPLEE